MERILDQLSVSPFDERACLCQHRLSGAIPRRRLSVEAERLRISCREDAGMTYRCDGRVPDLPRLFGQIFGRIEIRSSRDRLEVVHARGSGFSAHELELRGLRSRSSLAHRETSKVGR